MSRQNNEDSQLPLGWHQLHGYDLLSMNVNDMLGQPTDPEATGSSSTSLGKRNRRNSQATTAPAPLTVDWLYSYFMSEFGELVSRIEHLELSLAAFREELGIQEPVIKVDANRREISRGHLDRYCLPILETSPDPTIASFNRIEQQISKIYRHLDRKSILSQVRKWFRKRREEMGGRIASSVRRHFAENLQSREGIIQLTEKIMKDECDLLPVINDARLEITDVDAAKEFTKLKVRSILERYRPVDIEE